MQPKVYNVTCNTTDYINTNNTYYITKIINETKIYKSEVNLSNISSLIESELYDIVNLAHNFSSINILTNLSKGVSNNSLMISKTISEISNSTNNTLGDINLLKDLIYKINSTFSNSSYSNLLERTVDNLSALIYKIYNRTITLGPILNNLSTNYELKINNLTGSLLNTSYSFKQTIYGLNSSIFKVMNETDILFSNAQKNDSNYLIGISKDTINNVRLLEGISYQLNNEDYNINYNQQLLKDILNQVDKYINITNKTINERTHTNYSEISIDNISDITTIKNVGNVTYYFFSLKPNKTLNLTIMNGNEHLKLIFNYPYNSPFLPLNSISKVSNNSIVRSIANPNKQSNNIASIFNYIISTLGSFFSLIIPFI